MSQANQPVSSQADPAGSQAEPSNHDEAPQASHGIPSWVTLLLVVVAVGIAVFITYIAVSPSGDESSSVTPPPVPSGVGSVEASKEETKPPKEEKKADEVQAEEEPVVDAKYERQCRDDKFVADCREATPEELNACGFCVGGACSGGGSSVRLVCESKTLVAYAMSVAQSGEGTVNLCKCQTQQAPTAAAAHSAHH